MSKDYPPGVTGNEPQITGTDVFSDKPQKRVYGIKHERVAHIVKRTDAHIYVEDVTGATHILTKGSIDSTLSPVGTRGTVKYITGPSYGLWFFFADPDTP